MVRSGRPGAVLLALAAAVFLAGQCFVQGPGAVRSPNRSLRRLSTSLPASATEPAGAADAKAEAAPAKGDASKEEQIDDAVLKMAMAMAEEDEGPVMTKTDKMEDEGFDFNIIITLFWTALIIYSFGSSIIGVTQGRIQDRTGGDFTAYDFFDNIFSFKDWNIEYTLGFDPFKLWDQFTSKGGAAPPA